MISNKLNKIVFISFILLTAFSCNAFSQIDSEAVSILDNMSDKITNLESCSFVLKTEYDIYNNRLGLVKFSDEANVFLKAPDKLLVNKKGDRGHKDFYYDGKTFSYYSEDNNCYATAPAPSTILETIDSIHNELGIDFPAADIFYPDLVDNILANSDNLSYLGLTNVEDKECFHIAGTNDEFTYQIWIANDESYLPVKLIIVYTSKIGNPQYEALFRNWSLNPVLQDSMFDFAIPEGATKIKFAKKN
jgi:hypothetical protein